MFSFGNSKKNKEIEEQAFLQVGKELREGMRKEALWLKALSESEGLENKAGALYMKFRAKEIMDEIKDASKKVRKFSLSYQETLSVMFDEFYQANAYRGYTERRLAWEASKNVARSLGSMYYHDAFARYTDKFPIEGQDLRLQEEYYKGDPSRKYQEKYNKLIGFVDWMFENGHYK